MNVCAAKFPLISLTKVRVWRCIPKISFLKKKEKIMKKNNIYEILLRILIAAATAALTAVTTTSCMGHGPF